MRNDNLTILAIGLAGCHGQKSNIHITYSNSDLIGLFYHLAEGGYVIDKSGPLSQNPRLALFSPMCDCSLQSGEVNPIGISANNIVLNALASQSDVCRLIARLVKSQLIHRDEPGPFDYISPEAYTVWWAKKGATVGQRNGNSVVWLDGTCTGIVKPG